MKTFALMAAGVVACVMGSGQAYAQAVTPATTSFSATGSGVLLTKPGFGTSSCTLTLTGATGANLGGNRANTGTLSGGTNTGGGACPALTVDGSGFKIVSIVTSGSLYAGTIDHVVVRYSGTAICDDTNVPFTIDDTGFIDFDTNIAAPAAGPAGTCHVTGTVVANNGVVGVN